MGPGQEASFGIPPQDRLPFDTLHWPGGGHFLFPPSMPAAGLAQEIIRRGFWERWRVYFFLQAPKHLGRHVYVNAKKLPEGKRKNSLSDVEFSLHRGNSQC